MLKSKQTIQETAAKVKVVGARQIWGMLKTCSPGAVSTTISKLVPTTGTLRVKRKTKRLANKTVWWFVVHGSENDLTLLEQSWGKIQSQTRHFGHYKSVICQQPPNLCL